MLFFTAAIWAAGIAYFWPTMLAYVSERNPKSGALGLGMMGAMGMMAAAFVTPYMGTLSDQFGHDTIPVADARSVLEQVESVFPSLAATGPEAEAINDAVTKSSQALAEASGGALPPVLTTQALRAIDKAKGIGSVANSSASDAASSVSAMLMEADSTGGKTAFEKLSVFGIILIVVFGGLLLRDRARGGYQQEHLVSKEESTTAA